VRDAAKRSLVSALQPSELHLIGRLVPGSVPPPEQRRDFSVLVASWSANITGWADRVLNPKTALAEAAD